MTAAIPTLTTQRLLLRPLELADADAIQRVFPQWEIVRFLNHLIPWPYPVDGALAFLRDIALPGMAKGKEWHWSIRQKTEPERLIGVIGLLDRPGDNRGFWLDPAFQRQGLMTEAAAAATDFWFGSLQRPAMRVLKAVANEPSSRISARSGMRLIDTIEWDYVSGRLATEVWEMTLEDWRAHQRG
jgi:[ribosomal protein S5]-alanine N-acetyltransferase